MNCMKQMKVLVLPWLGADVDDEPMAAAEV